MRYLIIAAGLIAASLTGFSGTAQACISIPGDMRIISSAIETASTPKVDKARLKRLRAVMLANRGRDARQAARYQAASRKALAMIGEHTIVPHDASKVPVPAPGTPKSAFLGC